MEREAVLWNTWSFRWSQDKHRHTEPPSRRPEIQLLDKDATGEEMIQDTSDTDPEDILREDASEDKLAAAL